MRQDLKPIEALTVTDLGSHPGWRFANDDISDETLAALSKTFPLIRWQE
jgi:hypothetical protein